MAEVGAAANIVGIVLAAAHVVRLLADDLKNIVHAPDTVQSLRADVSQLLSSVEALETLESRQWEALSGKVVTAVKTAIATCKTTCETQHSDLTEWTKRSTGGKRSWIDQVNIGFWKKNHIKAMSRQLQHCKVALDLTVSIASLFASSYTSRTVADIKAQLEFDQHDVDVLAVTTRQQATDIENSLADLRVTEHTRQEPGGSDEDEVDRESAQAALQQELATVKALEDLVKELQAKLKEKSVERTVKQIQNNFGSNNHGVQLGENSGTMYNSFGSGGKLSEPENREKAQNQRRGRRPGNYVDEDDADR